MEIKFINHSLSSLYSQSSTSLSGLDKLKKSKGKTYQFHGVFEKNYDLSSRTWHGFRALVKTVASFGLGLLFSKEIRNDWKAFWTGKKVVIVYRLQKKPASGKKASKQLILSPSIPSSKNKHKKAPLLANPDMPKIATKGKAEPIQEEDQVHEKVDSLFQQTLSPPVVAHKEDATSANSNKSFGNKFAGLVKVHQLFQKHPSLGVIIPFPEGLSHTQVMEFLESKAPQIFIQRAQLAKKFRASHNKAKFLKNPDVIKSLTQIRKDIEEAFLNHSQDFDAQNLSTWLQTMQKQGNLLMVRSSSIEDTSQVVNAGGNLSEAYVEPELSQVLASSGRVIASFFGEMSLKNQIQAGLNPFDTSLQLSVVLQELIGESLKENQAEIPVSLVLFTDEPNYSEKGFRVTTISSTFGHGEGVVNNEQVKTDTIYAVKSRVDSNKLVEIYQNQHKEERLAPVKSNQKVALELVNNPPELANQRSLSKEMVKRLVNLGEVVEKEMGRPMDMEIVVKGDKIYIVQMREIKRTPATPTYLSDEAIQTLETNPILAQEHAKVLVAGKSNAQKITSHKDVLVCKTLKEAESLFVLGKHKCVIVSTDEPSNSHPIINFSGLGIPCFYTEQLAEDFIQQMNKEKPLVICPQSGRLSLWNQKIAKPQDFIKSGYFSHPAYMNFSLRQGNASTSSQTRIETPKEIQETLLALKTAQEQEVALKALNQLKQLPALIELKQKISKLEQDPITFATPQTAAQIKVLKKLDKRIQKTFTEIEASYQHQAPRLEKLFHIKALSTLLADNSSQSYSLLQASSLVDEIEKAIRYQKKLSAPAKFVHLLPIGDKAFSIQNSMKWESFLLDLEKQDLDKKSVQKFQNLMTTVQNNESIPMWFNLIFLPSLEKKNSSQALKSLLNGNKQQVAAINDLNRISKDMQRINQSLFSHPKAFDKAWQQLQPIMQHFASPAFLNHLSGSKLANLLAIGLMKKYTDLVDETIKTIKSNSNFSDQEKIDKINLLLKENYHTLQTWSTEAYKQDPFPLKSKDLAHYFKFIDTAWQKCDLLNPSILSSSHGFSVLAATLGSSTLIERHTPKTLEDIFTLIHQNQLFIVSHFNKLLLTDPLIDQLELPILFQDAMKKMNKIDYHPLTRTGVNINEKSMAITYNLPLNNHSANIELEWNQSSGMMMHVKFFGERGGTRWRAISEIVQVLNEAGIIKAKKISSYTDQEIQYSWEIEENTLATVMQALECFTSIADGGRQIVQDTSEFSKSLGPHHEEKLIQAILDRIDKNIDYIYDSPAWLLAPYLNSPLIAQKLKKIQKNYGKSNNVNVLHKEIDHFISLDRRLRLSFNSNEEIFNLVIPRYFKKNISAKQGAKLLNSCYSRMQNELFISLAFKLIKNQISSRYKNGAPRKAEQEKEIIQLFKNLIKECPPSKKLQLLDDVERFIRVLTPSYDPYAIDLVKSLMNNGRCFDLVPNWIAIQTHPSDQQIFQNQFEAAKQNFKI